MGVHFPTFYFRIEILLPTNWFKTVHSIGDSFSQRALENTIRKKELKKGLLSPLHPYDLSHKEWAAIEYAKKLEKWPQHELIERLLFYEEEKQLQFKKLWKEEKELHFPTMQTNSTDKHDI